MKNISKTIAFVFAMVFSIAHGQDRQEIFNQIMNLVGDGEYELASKVAGQLDNDCQHGFDILLYSYRIVRKSGATERYVSIFYADPGTMLHDLPGFPQRILERIYAGGQTIGEGDFFSIFPPIKIDCTKKTPEMAPSTNKKGKKSGRA